MVWARGVLLEGADFLVEKSFKVLWIPNSISNQEHFSVNSKPIIAKGERAGQQPAFQD